MNMYTEEYQRWLSSDAVDGETKRELSALAGSDEELRYRFSGYLSFGTAGLRGIMGAGTNMMNVYTVRHATQGLAQYILSADAASRGAVIAYDSRIGSRLFAEAAASVLAANGIRTFLFDGMRPTPVLSFAVRQLGCAAGINITASHNSKEYNGYKAYWSDGAQLAPEQAEVVSRFIRETDILTGVRVCDFEAAVAAGKIVMVGKETDESYYENVLRQSIDPEVIRRQADMKVVYTPLHGAGRVFVPQILKRAGFSNVITVPEQMIPDGSFPTVRFPNPEFPEAFALGVKLARENDSDLIIATDPDADRTGIMVRRQDGSFTALTGNQTGALLLHYIISALKATGTMPPEPYAVKSIVTTELASAICRKNGVKLFNVLTGFKFIGEVIKTHEEAGHGSFLFGFEESYGYLKGTYARDKDAVVASLLIAEMAAAYRERGMTLYDALQELYETYGYSAEKVVSLTAEGYDGAARMRALMKELRGEPIRSIGKETVHAVRDYLTGRITVMADGSSAETGLPSSDVLYYETEAGDAVIVRPSGTEPKVKLYFLVGGKTAQETEDKLSRMEADMRARVTL